MGYYVRIEETASNFKIKKENFERGYEIVCDLNRHDYLKHGGSFGGDPTPKPADSKSCADNPDVWFSWMPWNYDELCGNLVKFSKWSVSGSNLTMPETFPSCRMTTRRGARKLFSTP